MARLGFAKRLLGATEPDERAHSGDEHGRLRGLGQIAVGAAVQAAHGVAAVHEGGGDLQDEGGGGGRVVLDFVAADVGQRNVE